MQAAILWSGNEYKSREHCHLTLSGSGAEANATIIGLDGDHIIKTDYTIRTNDRWETLFCQVQLKRGDQLSILKVSGDGKGNWTLNNEEAPQFKGCLDVDILFTPFTNSLPVNRLALGIGQSKQISVLYFDLAANELRKANQQYTRLSDKKYKFQNVPNDFEAELDVDELGLVISYPGLFVRKAIDRFW